MEKHAKKGFSLHVIKKDEPSLVVRSITVAIAIVAALLVSAIFIFFVTKLDPISVYTSMFKGAFGTARRSWITIRDTCLLLMISVSLAPAFRMRFWNCGAWSRLWQVPCGHSCRPGSRQNTIPMKHCLL